MVSADTRPRRLVLFPTELEVLRRRTGVRLPPGFAVGPDGEATGHEQRQAFAAAVETLAARGVVQPDSSGDPLACEVHPSARANLWVFQQVDLLLQTRARYGATSVRATHAVAGPYGAGLVRLDERAVELSFFLLGSLRWELARVVPEVWTAVEPETLVETVVRLDTLEQVSPALQSGGEELVRKLVDDLGVDPSEVAVARALDQQLAGFLQCLVFGPPSASGADVHVGQVIWFATPGGWIGAAPEPGPDGERLVRLVPVEREDLGAWTAPFIGGALR